MCDASSFPPTLHSDITKSTTKTHLVGWLGPPLWCAWATLTTILLQVNPVGGTPRGQPLGLQGPPGPSGDCPSSYCSPLRGLFLAMWQGRPCHAHPSQEGQGAGLTVQCHVCLIPVKKNKCISDSPLKGSSGFLSRSSQRRPPAPSPFISS